MLIQKVSPVGVDKVIDKLQVAIYDYLTGVAGFTQYESYPRCYKNYKDGMIIPEMYTGTNEYKEVLFDDRYNLTSFFIVDDDSDREGVNVVSQNVSIIFQGLLDKLFPSVSHRADEELKAVIYNALSEYYFEDYLLSIQMGIDNVYGDLRILGTLKDRVILDDMSNFNVLRFNFKLNFNIDKCKTSQL